MLNRISSKILHLLTDSRLLVDGDGTLFFAIKTATNDGHKYIDELIARGVKAFVVDNSFEIGNRGEVADFVVVDNVVDALQQFAIEHRCKFNLDVIAITGSNGKTIVKEWLRNVLTADYKVVATPKSYNSQIGVPLSLWQIKDGDEIGIFEAGISQKGEMEVLAKMIRPHYGIFTHLGDAHNEGFGSLEEKVISKLDLFVGCEVLIVGGYDGLVARTIQKYSIDVGKLFTYGYSEHDTLQIIDFLYDSNCLKLKDNSTGEYFDITTSFDDKASIENLLSVISMMIVLGYGKKTITDRVKTLDKVEMRLEVKEGMNDCVIINDSYSFDLDSLVIALDYLSNNYKGIKKSIILSDMVNIDREEKSIYANICHLIEKKNVDRVVLIGNHIINQFDDYSGETLKFNNVDEFLNSDIVNSFSKEVVLVKGARRFHFEQIVKALESKSHGTILDVNLGALVHNFKYYKSLIDSDVKVAAMVKAFGYGAGSYEVARMLRFHNVDYLVVAYSDEGRELRRVGIDLPIMVMNPEDMDFEVMSKYDLEPEIYSMAVLDRLIHESNNIEGIVKVHIKLDTGMHRLGFIESEVVSLVNRIVSCPNIKIASIFSHLAASDSAYYDAFTIEQITCFTRMADYICSQFDYKILRHIANTSGISRFPQAHFDMVRLGIGLYGVSNDTEEMAKLKTVSSLKSFICQIKEIKKGDSVGYNRNAIMSRNSIIGVVPIGYADGYMRMFGNGCGEMFVNNVKVHTVGNICMDMCMIDITDVECKEGDSVEIFGENISVSYLASKIGTIPYELLTGVSRRVKRVYFND